MEDERTLQCEAKYSVYKCYNSAREGKYTATTLRKKILSISQRIKILTDRKILLRTSLYAGYMESTIDIQRDAVFQSLHGLHSTYFSRA